MRYKKFFAILLMCVLFVNFSNMEAFAAEKNDANQADRIEKDDNKSNEEEKQEEAAKKYTEKDLRLLSALVYCEAQSESYNGKLAVAIVVMNRKRSGSFPDTIKDVIYQKYQFSPVTSGTLKKALAEYDKGNFTSKSEKACIKAAKEALSGTKSITVKGKKKNFSGYLYFSGSLRGYTYRLGNHRFK